MIPRHTSTPWVSVVTLSILLTFAALLILSDKANTGSGLTIIALIAANLPSALSAIFAERVSRDIRNGVVVEKSRQGTVQALADTGVVESDNQAVQDVKELDDGR